MRIYERKKLIGIVFAIMFVAMLLPFVTAPAYAEGNTYKAGIEIKVLDDKDEPVPGVVFSIRFYKSGEFKDEFTTEPSDSDGLARTASDVIEVNKDSDNYFSFGNLVSDYNKVEITAVSWPEDYAKPYFDGIRGKVDITRGGNTYLSYLYYPNDPEVLTRTTTVSLDGRHLYGLQNASYLSTNTDYEKITDNNQYIKAFTDYRVAGSADFIRTARLIFFTEGDFTDFIIEKTDKDSGAPLEGVIFEIRAVLNDGGDAFVYQDGTIQWLNNSRVIAELTTDENGKASIKGLPQNVILIVEEKKNPYSGYIAPDHGEFAYMSSPTIPAEPGKNAQYILQVTNEQKKYDVKISKQILGQGTELAEAELSVTGKAANGNAIKEISWTSDGTVKEIKLPAGEYTLTETAAPDGYVIAASIDFRITTDGKVEVKGSDGNYTEASDAKITMEDDWTKVKISKTDITGSKEIGGAKLQVIDKNGTVVEEWTSEEGKSHEINAKLIAGESYTLKEITAPDGYEIAEDIKFTVNNDGSVLTVVMKDAEKPKVEEDNPKIEEPIPVPESSDSEGEITVTTESSTEDEDKEETSKTVDTSDADNITPWLAILLASAGSLGAMGYRRKRIR